MTFPFQNEGPEANPPDPVVLAKRKKDLRTCDRETALAVQECALGKISLNPLLCQRAPTDTPGRVLAFGFVLGLQRPIQGVAGLDSQSIGRVQGGQGLFDILQRNQDALPVSRDCAVESCLPLFDSRFDPSAVEQGSAGFQAQHPIGSNPEPALVDTLVARCAIEPDFYVRDMLTWALTRLPNEITVPKLVAELHSEDAQARSRALHTLSKIKDASAWPAITRSLLCDSDVEAARSAWRAAVVLVPDDQKKDLADELAEQLGRGSRDVQLSLSRALVALGEEVVEPVLREAMECDDPGVRAHASATERLLRDPSASFKLAIYEAKRLFVLGKEL